MASSLPISGLTAAGALATGDLAVVVDVSDTTMASTGTDKKATLAQLVGVLAGDLTPDGTDFNVTVSGINGQPLGSTSPTAGNLLVGSGSQWASVAASGDVTLSASGAFQLFGLTAAASVSIGTGVGSPQNDWNPSGWLSAGGQPLANVLKVTVTAPTVITGLKAPSAVGFTDGARVQIQVSVTGLPLILACATDARATSSSAANRFGFAYNAFVDPGANIDLIYDATAARWRATAPIPRFDIWSGGADGDVSWTSTQLLARDFFYRNLTIGVGSVTSVIDNVVYVDEWLDVSAAPAGAVICNGGAGGNGGNTGTAGSAGALPTQGAQPTLPIGQAGVAGATGTTTAGSSGTTATSITVINAPTGTTAGGGVGGLGSAGAGGGKGNGISPTQGQLFSRYWIQPIATTGTAVSLVRCGIGGASGGGGGGDNTVSGGGSGGGGASPGTIKFVARYIWRGSSNSATGIIQCKGGNGGNGGSPASGNAGGGGAGGGGQGGWIDITHSGLYGTAISAALDATGGNGGTGGNKTGTGVVGNGGVAGPGGFIQILNLSTGALSQSPQGSTVANSGQTGGTATTYQVAL
jgi:hypothetical protein